MDLTPKRLAIQYAIPYGVPLPETCKKLEWQQAAYAWYIDDDGFVLRHLSEKDLEDVSFYAYAPQIHDILQILPNSIVSNNRVFDFQQKFDCVCYTDATEELFYVEIMPKHHVQALAELYIELKSKSFIWK